MSTSIPHVPVHPRAPQGEPVCWAARQVEPAPNASLLDAEDAALRGRTSFTSPEGWSMEGLGEAYVLRSDGPARLHELAARAEALFGRLGAPAQGPDLLPRLIGGFSFAPRKAHPDPAGLPWEAFGGARFVLPEVGLWRRGDESVLFAVSPPGLAGAAARAHVEARLDDAEQLLSVAPPPFASPARATERLVSDPAFEGRVGRVLQEIRGGRANKITVATWEGWRREAGPGDATDVLRRLEARAAQTWRFWMQPPGAPAFLGTSPERLLAVDGDRVRTEALAGTVACSGDAGRDAALVDWLQSSKKERREHEAVVQFLRDRFANIALDMDVPAEPRICRLADVQHLQTPLAFRTDPDIAPRGILRLADRIHPTPAVCGVPAETAAAWLAREEPFDRGWYTGAVGVVDAHGNGELSVAIRCALMDEARAWLFAGAGIVEGSSPARERVETEHKLRGLREVLCG